MTAAHSIETLPFVTIRADGMPNLWNVQATGDWSADCATGREYGEALVAQMRERGDPSPLARIVAAMPSAQTGIEVGFLTAVAGNTI